MGSSSPAGRIEWVDALRGLGIIFVVAGHVFTQKAVNKALFLFHMPLFFVLSGFMFKPEPLRQLVAKRLMTLLVPYACFLILVTGLDLVAFKFDNIHTLPLHPLARFFGSLVYGGTALTGSQGVAWFVPCLFWTNILYAAASAKFGGPRNAVMIALAIGMHLLAYLLPPVSTPLGLGQVPFAFSFFWAGNLLRELKISIFVVCACVIVLAAGVAWAPMVDMKHMQFGWPGITAAVALAGTMAAFGLAKSVPTSNLVSLCLSALGRAALVIMFLHLFFVVHLRPIAPEWLIFIVGLAVPYLAYLLFERIGVARVLFLGRGKLPVRSAGDQVRI